MEESKKRIVVISLAIIVVIVVASMFLVLSKPNNYIYTLIDVKIAGSFTVRAEVHWHRSQQAVWHDDGSVTLSFRVKGLGEISWWLLGYGDRVKVLAPQELKCRMLKTAKNMVKNLEK